MRGVHRDTGHAVDTETIDVMVLTDRGQLVLPSTATGGIGANAVQGVRIAGARNIIALDPVDYMRNCAKEFG